MSGKRVARACDRCRLKKAKCNGASPCDRCSSADLICEFIQRPRPKRVYPSGYVEMLEEQQQLLITGLRKLYSCVVDGQGWPYPPLEQEGNGKPLIHDILKSMGVLPEPMLDPSSHVDRWGMPSHRLRTGHHLSIDTTTGSTSTASTMSEFDDAQDDELDSPTDSIASAEMVYHSSNSSNAFSIDSAEPMTFDTAFQPSAGEGGDTNTNKPSFYTPLIPPEQQAQHKKHHQQQQQQQQAAFAFQALMGQPAFDTVSAAAVAGDVNKTDEPWMSMGMNMNINLDADQFLDNITWPMSSSSFGDVGWLDPTTTATTTTSAGAAPVSLLHDPIGGGVGQDPLTVYT